MRGIRNKIIWTFDRFDVNSDEEKYIEIPLDYETSQSSEDVTLLVLAFGTLTGILSKNRTVFAKERIDLKFLYNTSEIIDQTPPITYCILEGKKTEVI